MSSIVYYVQINIVAIVICVLILAQIRNRGIGGQRSFMLMKQFIFLDIVNCISDILASYFSGKLFVGARAWIELSNTVYLLSLSLCAYLWFVYVVNQVNEKLHTLKFYLLSAIPTFITGISLFLNPFTKFFFYIDDNNCYVRSVGITFYWVSIVLYIVGATFLAHFNYKKTKNPSKKGLFKSLLKFVFPVTITCCIQFFFLGVTVNQIGLTISILLLFLDSEASMVLKDELTGLNNKRAMIKDFGSILEKRESVNVSALIIHIENLKQINDSYGRQEGDFVIKTSANILNESLYHSLKKSDVYRYDSNDFLILIPDLSRIELSIIKNEIIVCLEKYNQNSNKDYKIEFIFGAAADDEVSTEKELNNLIMQADADAYYNL